MRGQDSRIAGELSALFGFAWLGTFVQRFIFRKNLTPTRTPSSYRTLAPLGDGAAGRGVHLETTFDTDDGGVTSSGDTSPEERSAHPWGSLPFT